MPNRLNPVTIPYTKHQITDIDIAYVKEVLCSDFITQGSMVNKFEEQILDILEFEYGDALAVNSGTSALHLACLALGVSKGDLVWTSPLTFAASANCARMCGARVDFVDVDPITGCMDTISLEEKLYSSPIPPKVVIPVHYAGHSCQMKKVKELANKYGFSIIEDACHALGGKYLDKYIGSCEFSDAVVFSFHPAKAITTGEGGMVLTNNPEIGEKIRRLRSHGIEKDKSKFKYLNSPTDIDKVGWFYEQWDLGYNYRMTDIQAALGFSQSLRLEEYQKRRRDIADRYQRELNKEFLTLPCETSEEVDHAWHLYVVQVLNYRNNLYEYLHSLGIYVQVHYPPVHLHPYYQELKYKKGDFPVAERLYYHRLLSLPMYPSLTEDQQSMVIYLINRYFK